VSGDFKGGILNPTMTFIDLQIGSRVRIIKNICVRMGLHNGAMGTVHAFVYKGEGPTTENRMRKNNFSALEYAERELPVILVRMDGVDDPNHPTDSSKSSFK
jgi:hypothetical protein